MHAAIDLLSGILARALGVCAHSDSVPGSCYSNFLETIPCPVGAGWRVSEWVSERRRVHVLVVPFGRECNPNRRRSGGVVDYQCQCATTPTGLGASLRDSRVHKRTTLITVMTAMIDSGSWP